MDWKTVNTTDSAIERPIKCFKLTYVWIFLKFAIKTCTEQTSLDQESSFTNDKTEIIIAQRRFVEKGPLHKIK